MDCVKVGIQTVECQFIGRKLMNTSPRALGAIKTKDHCRTG